MTGKSSGKSSRKCRVVYGRGSTVQPPPQLIIGYHTFIIDLIKIITNNMYVNRNNNNNNNNNINYNNYRVNKPITTTNENKQKNIK